MSDYTADQAVERYFVGTYLRLRESYNISTLRYNYNVLRLMSTIDVFNSFRQQVDPANEQSFAKRLGTAGLRDVKIRSLVYITKPIDKGTAATTSKSKIMQARITTTEAAINQPDKISNWIVTITFEYADLSLSQEEQLLNPLGFTVTSYQIQPEVE